MSKAPAELQKYCGKDIKEFKKMLSKFPETFVVKNNFVCLNIFENDVFNKTELIDKLKSAQQAVEEISKHKEIGLKVHGSLWGLSGKLSLISVVLPTGQIFIFDVFMCPAVLNETNLGKLLESEDILKICHTCQNDAGTLFNNFGVQLRHVFDTQCAFKTIQYSNPHMLDDTLTPQYLHLCNIMDYFELNGDDLFKKEEAVRKLVSKDAEVWMQRPLNQKLRDYAAASVAALPIIYSDMEPDWALKFNKVLYQNLVYEECFRFLNPLIVKRRQNIRQTALRAWKRKITTERHLVHYVERRNKDQIWKNDYSVKPKLAVNISNKPVGPKSSDSPEAPTSTAIQDLATKFFLSTSKRYYFDIKEQNGVRFVKISEISSMDQSRNLISINLNLVAKFRDVLDELQHRPMPPYRTDKSGTSLLHSVSIVKDTRRYLIDLKRNRWGYFIMISQMLPTGGKLSSVAFNLQDLKTFIQIFHDISEEWAVDEATVNEGSYMRFRNKRYFFNINQNQRGIFMRISEIVSPSYQSSMTIAEQSWDDFLQNFSRTIEVFRKSQPNTSIISTVSKPTSSSNPTSI